MDSKSEISNAKSRVSVIDLIGYDPKTGEAVLVMNEADQWNSSDEQLLSLQERFNAYVSFLLDGEMAAKLKEKRIPFELSPGGTSILVPKEKVYDPRLALTAEGLPKGGGVGFEVFDRTNLGATDFVQKLNYQRALQGELSRTIRQIKEFIRFNNYLNIEARGLLSCLSVEL